jgi:hypothetical protein
MRRHHRLVVLSIGLAVLLAAVTVASVTALSVQ